MSTLSMKEIREAEGLTQHETERRLGWSRGTLSKYENGKVKVPENKKKEFEELFNIVNFVETPAPEPVNDDEPDRFGPFKNHEGYHDPTAALAMKPKPVKNEEPYAGEIWTNTRPNGATVKKLVLFITDDGAMCVRCFAQNKNDQRMELRTASGIPLYADWHMVEYIKLRYLDNKIDAVNMASMDGLYFEIQHRLGLSQFERVKEVVNKVIDGEDKHKIELLEKELEIYKDMVDRLLLPRKENWI